MPLFKRFIFYALLLLASYYAAKYCVPTIEAKAAARALVAFAVVSGVVQSVTLTVISKLVNVSKLEGLAYWSKRRLIGSVLDRISQLKIRLLLGVLCAVAIGILSGAAFALGTAPTPVWLVCPAIFFSVISVLFAMSAILEYVHIHKLEVELSDTAARAKEKREYFGSEEDES